MGELELWREVLQIKLDGIMFHEAEYEMCCRYALNGLAQLHKHHVLEETESYLDLLGMMINAYGDIGIIKGNIYTSNVIKKIKKEDTMIDALQEYDNWEHETCHKLKDIKEHITAGQSIIDNLIEDVHQERIEIRDYWHDIEDGKAIQLDKYLCKKYGE